jgi:hypothetical protein
MFFYSSTVTFFDQLCVAMCFTDSFSVGANEEQKLTVDKLKVTADESPACPGKILGLVSG